MNLFYPSHDIALGNGIRHFNPPKAAQMLQEDLAWLEEIFANQHPQPWGWNWDTREYLARELHIDRTLLPDDAQLEALRMLSNRRTMIELLQAIDYKAPMPQYLSTIQEVDNYMRQADESGLPFVLKTPWSSSGRGLIRSSQTPRPIMRQRALATIRKMGGIMAERWMPKLQDFALLYWVGHNKITSLGYSLFDNDSNGTYRQGYLLSNEAIEKRICAPSLSANNTSSTGSLSIGQLHQIRDQIAEALTRMLRPYFGLPWQVGYLGIDLMTLHDCEWTWACCEMNLRCTMGIVARLWADRNLPNGSEGRFMISPMDNDGHFEAEFITDKKH